MGKKYELAYRDVDYTPHMLEIYDDSYSDAVIDDITGRVWLSTSSGEVHDPVKGQSLRVELDATSSRDFSDLFEGEEMRYRCVYSINGFIKFVGWVNPEGWWEDLNSDNWVIEFDAVDGIGYLDGLAYVQSSGLHFTGVQSLLDIVVNCLDRIGLNRDIYFDLDIRYTGIPSTVAIETHAKFNSERFYQDDEEPMSCLEVLKSTLNIFSACLTQRDGSWFVYRPNQLARIPDTGDFNRYDYTGAFINDGVIDITDTIISEANRTLTTDKVYVNYNQRLSNLKSIGGFSVNYKYGLAQSLSTNPELNNATGLLSGYTGWLMNVTGNSTACNPGESYIRYNILAAISGAVEGTATTINLNVGDLIQVKSVTTNFTYPLTNQNIFYYDVVWVVGATTWYLYSSGGWASSANKISVTHTGQETVTNKIEAQELPGTVLGTAGTLTINMYGADGAAGVGNLDVEYLGVTLLNEDVGEIEGEFHTVKRTAAPSSKIDEPTEVFTGDNPVDTYEGAIYKLNGSTNTDEWTRDHIAETKPILQVMCEDRLRMNAVTRKQFSGDVKGYIDYLSVITLEGLDGLKFLPVEYNYNSMQNVTNVKMHQLLDEEVADTEYTVRLDRGTVVKPKIEG